MATISSRLVPFAIGPGLGTFLGFLLGALVHVSAAWIAARAAGASVLAVLLVDMAHFVCAGAIAAGAVSAFAALRRRTPVLDAAALFVLALVVGWLVLEPAFHNFCVRHSGRMPPTLLRFVLTFAASAVIPVAWLVGRVLRRFRFGRAVGLVLATLVFAANERILPRDYAGIHAYLGWFAATLGGAAFVGVMIPLPFGPPRLSKGAALRLSFGAGVIGFALLVSIRPSARTLSALSALDASVLVQYSGKLRRILRNRGDAKPLRDAWLEDRVDVPATPESPRAFPKRGIVLLLTIDALRADVVNSGRYDEKLPNFAALRKKSLLFVEARTTATATRPAIASMHMGTYTFQQQWVERPGRFGAMPSDETLVRFPQLLSDARVKTVNLSSMRTLQNAGGATRGYDVEKHVGKGHGYGRASDLMREILELMEKAKPPYFLYSHFGDPHEPYDLAGEKGPAFERYLGEVALVDRALGRLLERLDRDASLRRRTVLIVSADHGESFGQHDSSSHGTTLYDEVLRVPLLISAPGVAPRKIDDLVSLIDIGPTILDLFGVTTPWHYLGQSLKPYLVGGRPVLTRPIIGEARDLLSYVDKNRLKVIVDRSSDRLELYDLTKDPLELDNIADDTARLEAPLAYVEGFYRVHRLERDGYEAPPIR